VKVPDVINMLQLCTCFMSEYAYPPPPNRLTRNILVLCMAVLHSLFMIRRKKSRVLNFMLALLLCFLLALLTVMFTESNVLEPEH
jgi:cell division protein FtsW (lipid II flippase)